jgi:hypothetical protein
LLVDFVSNLFKPSPLYRSSSIHRAHKVSFPLSLRSLKSRLLLLLLLPPKDEEASRQQALLSNMCMTDCPAAAVLVQTVHGYGRYHGGGDGGGGGGKVHVLHG